MMPYCSTTAARQNAIERVLTMVFFVDSLTLA